MLKCFLIKVSLRSRQPILNGNIGTYSQRALITADARYNFAVCAQYLLDQTLCHKRSLPPALQV